MRSFKKIAAMIMAVAMLCSFTALGASVSIDNIAVSEENVNITYSADTEEVTAIVYSGATPSGANLVYIDQFEEGYTIPTLTLEPGEYTVAMGGTNAASGDADVFTIADTTKYWNVSATSDENGYIKCNTGTVEENTVLNITFAPHMGYELDTFTINGVDATYNAKNNGVYSYAHTVTADTVISVTYKPITADSVAGDAYISGGVYDIAGEENPEDPRQTAASKLVFGKALEVAGKTIKYMGMKVEVKDESSPTGWREFTTPKGAGPLFGATNHTSSNVYGLRFFSFAAGTYKATAYVQYEANGVIEEPVFGDSVEFEVR